MRPLTYANAVALRSIILVDSIHAIRYAIVGSEVELNQEDLLAMLYACDDYDFDTDSLLSFTIALESIAKARHGIKRMPTMKAF